MASRLAEWVEAQMRARNLSRNELSRQSGVAVGTLTRLLRYDHVPGPDILGRLADTFGADRDTVLELAGLVRLSDLPDELPPEVRDLARRLYRLDSRDRQAILDQFDGILKLVERHRE